MTWLVTGARGIVGQSLCRKLTVLDQHFTAVSSQAGLEAYLYWNMHHQLTRAQLPLINGVDTLIQCAPLWLLPGHVPFLASQGVKRIIAFSSSSISGKARTTDKQEQILIKNLEQAESELLRLSEQNNINLTIFRPSLIYGYGLDKNITTLAELIKRFRVFPLTGQGRGLRQPVHADDLVDAVLRVVNNSITYGRIYYLAGEEVFSYKEMIQRIFVGMGRKPMIVKVPRFVVSALLMILSRKSAQRFTIDMIDRMEQDLTYSNTPAERDFDYCPQPFLAQPERDLP